MRVQVVAGLLFPRGLRRRLSLSQLRDEARLGCGCFGCPFFSLVCSIFEKQTKKISIRGCGFRVPVNEMTLLCSK